MENTTFFNLTKNLQDWKESLTKRGTFTTDNILELESHVLDEMDVWKTKGLTEEEAYFVAQKRLGTIGQLSEEFKKVNRERTWLHRLVPVLKGVMLCLIFQKVGSAMSVFLFIAAAHWSLEEQLMVIVSKSVLIAIPLFFLGGIYMSLTNKKSIVSIGTSTLKRLNSRI